MRAGGCDAAGVPPVAVLPPEWWVGGSARLAGEGRQTMCCQIPAAVPVTRLRRSAISCPVVCACTFP